MKEIIKPIKDSIVQIRCNKKEGQSWGTGFLVSENGYALTAFHVVGDWSRDSKGQLDKEFARDIVIFTNGVELSARVISNGDYSALYDYAILKIDGLENAKPLRLGEYAESEEGDEILIAGYYKPRFSAHAFHRAMIASKFNERNVNYILLDTSCSYGGLSGSPVIALNTNKVLGILSKGGKGRLPQNFKTIQERILDFLNEHGPETYLNGNKVVPLFFLLDIIKEIEEHGNWGIGYGVSIEYAKSHLKKLGLIKE